MACTCTSRRSLLPALLPLLEQRPFAFFGHRCAMGAAMGDCMSLRKECLENSPC